MRRRVESFVRDQRLQGVGDALLAVVLAVSSVVPVLVKDDPSWGTPKAVGVSLALLSTVPIAWRARWPIPVAAIILFANGACAYAAAPHEAAFQPFVALTLAFYSVGSRVDGARGIWAPLALALAAIPVFAAAVVHGQSAGNAIPSYVWLIAAWAVGRTVRSWRHKTVALEAANRELAEQRELRAQAAVAVERGRIARELHDVIAHNVSMIVVQAGAAARVLAGRRAACMRCARGDRGGRVARPWMRCGACSASSAAPTTASRSRRSLACATSSRSSQTWARQAYPSSSASRASRSRCPKDRPLRVPDRAGGADQCAQARRRRTRTGDGALRNRRCRAGDPRRRRRLR